MASPSDPRGRLRDVLVSGGWQPEQVDEWLDEYARSLAKQIRNWDAEAAGYTEPQMAVYAAADLIDPTVEG